MFLYLFALKNTSKIDLNQNFKKVSFNIDKNSIKISNRMKISMYSHFFKNKINYNWRIENYKKTNFGANNFIMSIPYLFFIFLLYSEQALLT